MSKNKWNEKNILELRKAGKIRSYATSPGRNLSGNVAFTGNINKNSGSAAKVWMEYNLQWWCNEHSVSLSKEFTFSKTRKFRFDWAITAFKIGIEYEGIFAITSGHTSVKGYTKDTDKYNLAQQDGWKVLRFTNANYKTLLTVLDACI